MRKKLQKQGFTLIELLVVITIIAILASISVPVYNTVTERAKITKDLSNVKQILLGARIYAGDNDGFFPGGGTLGTSTAAFNELIPEYINVERIFFNGDPKKTTGNGDGTLAAGENCYSYVDGLSDSVSAKFPLMADWFTAAGATYDSTHVWWNSNRAVVGRVDASARVEVLEGGAVMHEGTNIFDGLSVLDP